MALTQKAIDLIKHYESLHDGDLKKLGIQPKLDPVGIWTIGWGHAVTDPVTKKQLKGAENKLKAESLYPNFDERQANDLLLRDTAAFESAVRALVPKTLKEDQIGALVAMAFNIGMGNFKTSSTLTAILKGDIKTAGDKMLLWNKATDINGVKVELKGLTYRRMSERDLLVSGVLKFYNV